MAIMTKHKKLGRGPRTGRSYSSRSPYKGGYMGRAAGLVTTYIDLSIIVLDQLVICESCGGTGIIDNLLPSDSPDLWDPCPDCCV
jgi:hypothetical protein